MLEGKTQSSRACGLEPDGRHNQVASAQNPGLGSPYRGREIELDFLRGLAILLVLDFHAPIHWMSFPFAALGFPNFGWAGVDIFFVLSGFLVGGLLIKEWRLRGHIDGRRFLIRRGFKIWPQYYVFLGLMLLTRHRSLHDLRGNLLNVQNYTGGIPHTWSLAVEEHAYLLLVAGISLAAYAKLRARTFSIALAVSALGVVIVRLVLITRGHFVVTQTHTRIEGILYGVLLAMVYHYEPAMFRRWQARLWVWLTAAGMALTYLRLQTEAPWSISLGWDAADLLGVSLLMLLYRPRQAKRTALYRLVAWVGVYSYGIYLWHVSVIAPSAVIASHLPHALATVWLALGPLVGGIALGALFTKVIEAPTLKLRDKFYPRHVDSPVGRPAEMEERQELRKLDATGQAARA